MIGYYDYTMILTYLSLLSASTGIIISLNGTGHPYIGTFFLLFCGLCDAFDGRVARTKDDRSEMEKKYGIQVDSLSDLVAFGILPACIGAAMIRTSATLQALFVPHHFDAYHVLQWILFALLIFYPLAAMIRLAYFNVTEEERQKTETGVRKCFLGLPVTSASLIFPAVMMLQYMLPMDLTLIYFPVALATGILFITPIKVPKPGLKGILIMVGIGLVEFLIMVIMRVFFKH